MDLKRLAKIHDALSNELRARVYFTTLSGHEPLHVSAIAAIAGISVPLASHHLKVLEATELVVVTPAGKYKLYSPSRRAILDLVDFYSKLLQGDPDVTLVTEGQDSDENSSIRPPSERQASFRSVVGEPDGSDRLRPGWRRGGPEA